MTMTDYILEGKLENLSSSFMSFLAQDFSEVSEVKEINNEVFLVIRLNKGGYLKITSNKAGYLEFKFHSDTKMLFRSLGMDHGFDRIKSYNKKKVQRYIDFFNEVDESLHRLNAEVINFYKVEGERLIENGFVKTNNANEYVKYKETYVKVTDVKITTAEVSIDVKTTDNSFNGYVRTENKITECYKTNVLFNFIEKGIVPTIPELFKAITESKTYNDSSLYYSIALDVLDAFKKLDGTSHKIGKRVIEIKERSFYENGRNLGRVSLDKYFNVEELFTLRQKMFASLK